MSEDSEDIIKKLTEDVPDGKATFPADEDDEFNLLLDNFIQSELKNIEEEKNNTRIMLEEPEPQPIKQNASDDEVADALELAEQKLYTAYRNYVDSIQAIADAHGLEAPVFHIKAQVLYPRYTPSLGNLISIDVLQGWDTMFESFPDDVVKIKPNATDEELLDFAEQHTDENLQMAVVSYVEILFEIEGCEIAYEKRLLEYEHRKIEEEIIEEHRKRGERARKYVDAIEKKKFPINAERLVHGYFKVAGKDPEGSFQALTTNPAIFAPIEIDKIKPKFFGLIKPTPRDGLIFNRKIGDFLKKQPSQSLGIVQPTYCPVVTLCELHEVLPERITSVLEQALPELDKRLHGFARPDAVLTAPETRSSSPVRIPRDKTLQASLRGLYPCGEGAGYAGGITSAALDGILTAEAVIEAQKG